MNTIYNSGFTNYFSVALGYFICFSLSILFVFSGYFFLIVIPFLIWYKYLRTIPQKFIIKENLIVRYYLFYSSVVSISSINRIGFVLGGRGGKVLIVQFSRSDKLIIDEPEKSEIIRLLNFFKAKGVCIHKDALWPHYIKEKEYFYLSKQ